MQCDHLHPVTRLMAAVLKIQLKHDCKGTTQPPVDHKTFEAPYSGLVLSGFIYFMTMTSQFAHY